jgi:hypothetical protein
LLNLLRKGLRMRRVDLVEASMQGWTRLGAPQRQRFAEAFLKALCGSTALSYVVAAAARERTAR